MHYKVTIICDVKLYDTKRIVKNKVKFVSSCDLKTKKEAEELLKNKVDGLKRNAIELYDDEATYTNIRGVLTEYKEVNKTEINF